MSEWILAGNVTEIVENGPKVVKGVAIFSHEDRIYAIENRCPHMGFPLHVGSLCDGILTCHWHHARFDVCSGGTLDPWADDVPTHDVRVEDGNVWFDPRPKSRRSLQAHFHRLREGMEQNLSLIIAKSVVSLLEGGADANEVARVGLMFGVRQRSMGWGPGLTILTAMTNVLPKLDRYGQILALFHGLTAVARDCADRSPRYALTPLPDTETDADRLAAWYRQTVEVRDTDGAERILRACLEKDVSREFAMNMMLVAVTDHVYLDGGHTFDFHSKAFEALSYVLESDVPDLFASLVPLLRQPTRSEELQNWQAPVDLVSPMTLAFAKLKTGCATDGSGNAAFDAATFIEQLLGDHPDETVKTLTHYLTAGIAPQRLAQCIVLAAAERILRFHVQNDFTDWIAVLHTFTHAHAVHQRLRQGAHPLVLRALYHTAMRIYLDRFLNIPAAARPKGDDCQWATPNLDDLLGLMDHRQNISEAAAWVAHYLDLKGDAAPLWNALGHAMLREDAEFHTYQMYEAAIQEYDVWEASGDEFAPHAQRTLFLAVTRYLAAHAPTARERPHIARIAWRLQRGEKLFEES